MQQRGAVFVICICICICICIHTLSTREHQENAALGPILFVILFALRLSLPADIQLNEYFFVFELRYVLFNLNTNLD